MPIKCLALDLATTTGWAVNMPFQSGTVSFKLKKKESPGIRFLKFEEWLQDAIAEHQPNLIVFEQSIGGQKGRAACSVAEGLIAITIKECSRFNIDFDFCWATTLKKWATGYGQSPKKRMVEEFEKRFRKKPKDDNEADAGLLLLWALSNFQ